MYTQFSTSKRGKTMAMQTFQEEESGDSAFTFIAVSPDPIALQASELNEVPPTVRGLMCGGNARDTGELGSGLPCAERSYI